MWFNLSSAVAQGWEQEHADNYRDAKKMTRSQIAEVFDVRTNETALGNKIGEGFGGVAEGEFPLSYPWA